MYLTSILIVTYVNFENVNVRFTDKAFENEVLINKKYKINK
jgi:hypothetical protein